MKRERGEGEGRTIRTSKKQLAKMIDKEIERAFYARCSRIQIPILKIPEIFKAGQEAAARGDSIEEAVVAAVERVRVAA